MCGFPQGEGQGQKMKSALTMLTIGDFSRATHLSLKTLRYYHRIGLLEPASIDASSGYRYYDINQIPTAQVIRRFRDLGMPVEEVRAVLSASLEERARVIAAHRERLEQELARTTASLAALEELTAPPRDLDIAVSHRTMPETHAIAIREVVRLGELVPWFRAAVREVDAALVACGASSNGSAGALIDEHFFTEEEGELTVFVPCRADLRTTARVQSITIPSAELAVVTHRGDHGNIDRPYGALGAYVAQNELKVEGPVREVYVVGRRETSDSSQWITEIGWPIFRTRSG
jgi:DNA-binding transcriptional MerR regulator